MQKGVKRREEKKDSERKKIGICKGLNQDLKFKRWGKKIGGKKKKERKISLESNLGLIDERTQRLVMC